jgi:hypothetical protein
MAGGYGLKEHRANAGTLAKANRGRLPSKAEKALSLPASDDEPKKPINAMIGFLVNSGSAP